MITLDYRAKEPIYEQIQNQIMELILVGALKPNDQLPSVRSLAKDLVINFNTVKKAFSNLEKAHVIYTVVGKGSFVAEQPLASRQLKADAQEKVEAAVKSGRMFGLTESEAIDIVKKVYSGGEKHD